MKVLLINGSPSEFRCTYTALSEVAATLEKQDIETELLYLGKGPIQGCTACRSCKTTGECIFGDIVNEVSRKLDDYDAIVVGSPVYYSSPAGQIISFLDRLFYSSDSRMKGKVGAAVVSCRRGGASAAFDVLNKYFSICNMPIATSQYWNQVHGNSVEEVLKDEEGMQTMRTLGINIAWLLNAKKDIEIPVYEEKIATNFIR